MQHRTVVQLGLILVVTLVFVHAGTASDAGGLDAVAVEELNLPPVADAGQSTTVECAGSFMTQWTTPVMLDGTGSADPDGDGLTYSWVAPGVVFDDPSTPTPTGRFPLGTTTVTLTVSDGNLEDNDTVDVTVEDTTPPSIAVSLNRDVLWPPNHMMANIFAAVAVTRDCCPGSPTVVLTSVASNEPDNGTGDGNTADDIQGADEGVRDNTFQLRSERSGGGEGRVYSIVYTATDCAGNQASATVYVRVPHDQSQGHALSSVGFSPCGTALDPGADRFVLILLSEPAKYSKDRGKKGALISEGFDATALDVEKTYVGNVKAALRPVRSMAIDQNGDGLDDLALYYASRDVNVLLRESMLEEGGTVVEGMYGSIGLQYTSPEGEDFLVPNIFALGPPVPLESPGDAESTEEAGSGDPSERHSGEIPNVTALLPNYPNPFNPSTTIPFSLMTSERVTLRVYDARGMLVRTLEDGTLPAGVHRVVWDGRDNGGRYAATGVYFVRLVAGDFQSTRKVVLIQ